MTIERKLEIPDGVAPSIEGSVFKVSGPKGENERNLRFSNIEIFMDGNELVIRTESERKKYLAMVGTIWSHANNMCKGVIDGFEYRMKVVYSHFPIQLKVVGNHLEIANFLGEKKARMAKIHEGVTVTVKGDEVVVTGIDKEKVGNTAANIESATRIRKRDPRVFQDGIYIVEKV